MQIIPTEQQPAHHPLTCSPTNFVKIYTLPKGTLTTECDLWGFAGISSRFNGYLTESKVIFPCALNNNKEQSTGPQKESL